MIEIQKYNFEKGEFKDQAPCWVPVSEYGSNKILKPIIVCKCGVPCGIGLHHVHADGTVTASFFHSKNEVENGCDWHVHLKLLDYDLGDFPARQK